MRVCINAHIHGYAMFSGGVYVPISTHVHILVHGKLFAHYEYDHPCDCEYCEH